MEALKHQLLTCLCSFMHTHAPQGDCKLTMLTRGHRQRWGYSVPSVFEGCWFQGLHILLYHSIYTQSVHIFYNLLYSMPSQWSGKQSSWVTEGRVTRKMALDVFGIDAGFFHLRFFRFPPSLWLLEAVSLEPHIQSLWGMCTVKKARALVKQEEGGTSRMVREDTPCWMHEAGMAGSTV